MATPRRYPRYKYVLAILDFVVIGAAFFIAFILEARWLSDHSPFPPSLILAEVLYIAFVGLTCIFVFHYSGLYQINVFVTVVDHLIQILKGLAIVLSGIAVLSFFTKADFIADSRLLILYFAVVTFLLFVIFRIGLFRWSYLYLSRNRVMQRRALIVGAGKNGKKVAVDLFLHDYTGVQAVGFLDDTILSGTAIFNGIRVVGRVSEVANIVEKNGIDELLICLEEVDHNHLMKLLERAMALHVSVKVSSPLYEIIPLRRSIEHYGNTPVVGVFQSSMSERGERYKRTLDIVLASIAVVVLGPMLAVIALLIKLDSKGPIFFRQVRVGKNGQHFNIYKFRSMSVGSEHDAARERQVAEFIKSKGKVQPEGSTKIVNEARVTRVGKWIRRFSLDEFPQLINVLRGEMSIVGPRPCLPYEWDHYEEWHKRRMSVLPGLTGIWQVTGRSLVGFEDMVILDLHYIQNASLILDLRVMLKTIPVMLFGTGAK